MKIKNLNIYQFKRHLEPIMNSIKLIKILDDYVEKNLFGIKV